MFFNICIVPINSSKEHYIIALGVQSLDSLALAYGRVVTTININPSILDSGDFTLNKIQRCQQQLKCKPY